MSWEHLKDQKLQKRLKLRARIIQLIREFFIKEGFLEVETPILVPAAGQEPHLNPMQVEFIAPPLNLPLQKGEKIISSPARGEVRRGGGIHGYLITSPEYAHKKLLAAGLEKTFEITRAFRAGEPWGGLHNPEFTILEWYRANADYTKIMEDAEQMVRYVTDNSRTAGQQDSKTIEYQGKIIDLSSPWQRLSVAEAFTRHAGTNLDEVPDEETFFKIFLTHIERKLGITKPTILYDYPASMAALARLKTDPRSVISSEPKANEKSHTIHSGKRSERHGVRSLGSRTLARDDEVGGVAERFELYIAGMELANAFSELNDAKEQRRRFLQEQKLRAKLGKEIIPLDEDFLDAVGHLPPASGIALGVDRLVMLLTDAARIEDVLAFPTSSIFPPLKIRGGEEGL